METRKPLFILPSRCTSCGKILSTYTEYQKRLLEEKNKLFTENDINNPYYTIDTYTTKNTIESTILDEMGIRNICCRNIFLTTSKNKTIINYE